MIESPRQTSAHKDLSASRLRYEAYEPPSRSTRGAGSGVGKSENQGNWKGKGKSDGALVESTQGGEGQRGRTSRGRLREERSLLFDSEQVEVSGIASLVETWTFGRLDTFIEADLEGWLLIGYRWDLTYHTGRRTGAGFKLVWDDYRIESADIGSV